MAPRWPQVNIGPEHIKEHATYLKEACNQLQAADKGRQNQVPWNTVQQYLASTIALIGKVLRQPAMGEILQQVQDAAKCTQNMQKDITIIKNSVGLSATPQTTVNITGRQGTSWAQVAAQAAKGTALPPPVPQEMTASKTQSTVTAYKDRVVTVKLKDHGIAQRYRIQSPSWARRQVETSIRDNVSTKAIKVVAAHQLKSGDIQIFTSSTAEATKLKEDKGWLRGLGENAEVIVPTYGVIVHGISTSSINIKDQKATIQQMLADNYTVIPDAKISYIGWLTKEAASKRASSIVVEFTEPEMANAIIYAGMAWDGRIHQCQLYDRACRVKQCFRCYNYGHIGTQCNASQVCGYCAERHETKHCQNRGMEGFTPRCAVCKDDHTAWSNACPAKKKEMRRVEQAKESRSIYWHVPLKETKRPRETVTTRQDRPRPPAAPQTASQMPNEDAEPREPAEITLSNSRPPVPREFNEVHASAEPPILIPSPAAQSIEDWETPATQQNPEQRDLIADLLDPQLTSMNARPDESSALDHHPQASAYPMEDLEEAALQDADAWLQDMANNDDNEWPFGPPVAEASPITSMATDTRTARGIIFKGCRCTSHQDIYSDWPIQDAELTIAKCMRICVYCGKDFETASALRGHMRRYNVRKSREIVLDSLFRLPKVLEYDLLAIQEPWRNPFKATTYHPLKTHFHLVYLEDASTRVCFYINKRIDSGTWSVSYISNDIIRLSIRNPHSGKNTDIFNVYNEVTTNTLTILAETLAKMEQPLTQTVVLGDFNLHHPLWSIQRRIRYGPSAQRLITIIEDFQLELLTEPGTPTHRWKDGESTIDLTFATEDLTRHVTHCKIDGGLDCDSDHLPIDTALDWEWKAATVTRKRLWSKTKIPILRQIVKDRLHQNYDGMEPKNEGDIDALVSSIVKALNAGIDASTPWSNPCSRSIAGFDQECKDICTEVQQLRRRWQQTRQDDDYEAYRQARNKKGRHIQKLLRNSHRQRVEEASSAKNGLWKLVKWAKNRQDISPACTPALAKPDGTLVHRPEEKAELLRQAFFPPPCQADLSDISGYQYPPSIECPDITLPEIEKAMRRAAPNKAPGADGIINGVLHQTLDILLPSLHKLFNACLQLSYCPQHFKEAVTVVLRKQGKDDYAQPKSYRPIALLNTLGKVMEAIMANRLAYLADVHHLLPSRHTGGRKLASTEHAIHFLLQRIHQAWSEGKVASLLLLDVSGAYDNVSHERLLHNLRKRRVSEKIVRWVASFLSDRSATLKMQEYTAPVTPIKTGIAQGSPFSPILYLFYNADLIEACMTPETEAVGYIDDVSILAVGPSAPRNCKTLKAIHRKAQDWATKHGSQFSPAKYELVHFTRDPKANSTHPLHGGRSNEAAFSIISTGFIDMGNGFGQPSTGIQGDDHTSDAIRVLSLARSR
ncbi:hypothetical protein VB005_01558 [Metarhizium brunneum]